MGTRGRGDEGTRGRGDFSSYIPLHIHAYGRGKVADFRTPSAVLHKVGPRELTIKRIAVKVAHLSVKDLYYLKSICEDARRRRGEWAKCFWGSLRVRKETIPT
jgi:hypothetical protein